MNNTLFFTAKQLFYMLERRTRRKQELPIIASVITYLILSGIFTLMAGLTLVNLFENPALILVPALVVAVAYSLLCLRRSTQPTLSPKSRLNYITAMQIVSGIVLIGGSVSSLFFLNSFPLFVVSVLLGMTGLYMGRRQRPRMGRSQVFQLDSQQFQIWLNRWHLIHAPIDNLISPVRETLSSLQPDTELSPDITAYSFDRLIVCDSADMVRFLVTNNFHFENNCAVLSITGYPQDIFATTMAMVRRNPDLKVYALHDCSPQGVGLVYRLRHSDLWFQNSDVTIFDVGLLPRQVIRNERKLFVRQSEASQRAAQQLPLEIRQSLQPEELAWLESGYFVELESFPPQRLIQILNRSVAESRELDTVEESNLILIGDSSSSYTYDSFG